MVKRLKGKRGKYYGVCGHANAGEQPESVTTESRGWLIEMFGGGCYDI